MSARQALERSRFVVAYRHLSPLMQSTVVVAAVAALTLALVIGGLLAFFAWDDDQFEDGPYCHAEPEDPLC